ncbi:MAG: recombinase family protein [Pseudomonadota bacterium]
MTRKRCAIYARKSTDEGLDQEFNSLDAQREACEAFVASQASLGWKVLMTRYDDGGFSGGSMERPALRQLLQDIRQNRIDVVLVYKIDRLTRSLADFSRMVSVFDEHEVSFVSVTQQFNTTSSMGRLTLNVLLSFAQFERDVTAERIRDKIAASKKKGIWMGGPVPLGYDAVEKHLVINQQEAESIRWLFQRYLELGSVAALKCEADQRGIRSKVRRKTDGTVAGGKPVSRGNFYVLLRNPIYAGMITHEGELYSGQHEAIVSHQAWHDVQELLRSHGYSPSAQSPPLERMLLAGLLYDDRGDRLVTVKATKRGKSYSYYVSSRLCRGRASDQHALRLPTRRIERMVTNALADWFAGSKHVAEALGAQRYGVDALRAIFEWTQSAAVKLRGAPEGLAECAELVHKIISRVDVFADRLAIHVSLASLFETAIGTGGNGFDAASHLAGHTIKVSIQIDRRGAAARMILHDHQARRPEPNPALIRLVSTAHRRYDLLTSGAAASPGELAKLENADPSELSRTLKLATLAPDIVLAILQGHQPESLTALRLKKLKDLPLNWQEQRELLGFSSEPTSRQSSR